MLEVFIKVYYILLNVATCFVLYYAFLGIVGLFFRKQRYPICQDELKFCIFVPCHNEETVIQATVKNLAQIKYNPKLFDIYFIADNCSDKTAERVREVIRAQKLTNFYVLERTENDPKRKGKPHAMNWGIELLEAENRFYDKYDMFMIFDADNFVDADILTHVNSQYLSIKEKKRPVMIQCYLDSKNKDSLIARGYYASYRITNGFFQLPKYKLGLVPAIGGTGFAMTTRFLKKIGGYHCTSLVEDLEIQTIATLKGERIAYNHNVRIYDEKPTRIKQSAVQKTRWAQGHWFVFFKYGWRMLLRMLNPKEIKLFFKRLDNLVYLSSTLFLLISMLSVVFSLTCIIMGIAPYTPFLMTVFLSLFMVLLFPISALLDGKKREKKRAFISFLPNLLSSFLGGLIFCYADIVGLFHCGNQKVWKKTAHRVTTMETTDTPILQEVATTKEEKIKEE